MGHLVYLSAPILVLWVPCPCFPLINHYFYKKLSLFIHIPNIFLGLGFELGPQRIGNSVIVCPQSVLTGMVSLGIFVCHASSKIFHIDWRCPFLPKDVFKIKSSFCHVLEKNKSDFLFNTLTRTCSARAYRIVAVRS